MKSNKHLKTEQYHNTIQTIRLLITKLGYVGPDYTVLPVGLPHVGYVPRGGGTTSTSHHGTTRSGGGGEHLPRHDTPLTK